MPYYDRNQNLARDGSHAIARWKDYALWCRALAIRYAILVDVIQPLDLIIELMTRLCATSNGGTDPEFRP